MLNAIFGKLDETGKWVKRIPKKPRRCSPASGASTAATVEEANSHRSYKVGVVTAPGLSEQQRIADAYSPRDASRVKGARNASDRATRYGILAKVLDVNKAVDRSFTAAANSN